MVRVFLMAVLATCSSVSLVSQSNFFTPVIQQMVNAVSEQNLSKHIKTLQNAGGYSSRIVFTPGNDSAVQYIFRSFNSLPVHSVELDTFFVETADSLFRTKRLFNVVATIRGKGSPGEAIVVGGHLDSYLYPMPAQWQTASSPGADDNATGIAAVLEIARIFSDTAFHFPRDLTTIFVAFNAEEASPVYPQWTYGSPHIARKLKALGFNVRATIVLDMVGHNVQYKTVDIVSNVPSQWIGERCVLVDSLYNLGLIMNRPPFPSPTYSDHSSFWNESMPAILLVENARPRDTSTYYLANTLYHTPADTFGAVNVSMVKGVTQLTLATLATLSSNLTSVESASLNSVLPTTTELFQNYPNPFNPTTNIDYTIGRAGTASLKVYDLLGQEIVTLVSKDHGVGRYTAVWKADDVPSGVYFYRLQSNEKVEIRRLILIR